jgi:hypothetical protein
MTIPTRFSGTGTLLVKGDDDECIEQVKTEERGEGETSYALPPESLRVCATCILA